MQRQPLKKVVFHSYSRLCYDYQLIYGFASPTGDLCGLGASLANAQRHKLVMAPGSLPTSVQSLVERIKNDIYGYMLAGAGGGGFLAIIAKKEGFGSKLQAIIAGSLDFEQFEIFPTEVDLEGLAYQNE